MAQHADTVLRAGTLDRRDRVRACMDNLVSAGLLHRTTPTRATSGPWAGDGDITTIGVVTADRPGPFHRSLASYVENAERHGSAPRFLVVDDSRRRVNQERTRHAVEDVSTRSPCKIDYVDEKERARLREALVEAGANERALRFALSDRTETVTTGANRNTLLLLTVGELMLSVDDDAVYDTWQHARPLPGIAFAGHPPSTGWPHIREWEVWF